MIDYNSLTLEEKIIKNRETSKEMLQEISKGIVRNGPSEDEIFCQEKIKNVESAYEKLCKKYKNNLLKILEITTLRNDFLSNCLEVVYNIDTIIVSNDVKDFKNVRKENSELMEKIEDIEKRFKDILNFYK